MARKQMEFIANLLSLITLYNEIMTETSYHTFYFFKYKLY